MTWDHQQAAQFLHDRDGFLILTHRVAEELKAAGNDYDGENKRHIRTKS